MADLYTTERIADLIRTTLDDTTEPYLVSDDTLLDAIDTAQREYAEQTLCLYDAQSYTVTLTAASEWSSALDARVMKIRSATLQSNGQQMSILAEAQMDQEIGAPDYGQYFSNWRESSGTPQYLVTDMQQGYLRVAPKPVANDTVDLGVYLYPSNVTDIDGSLTIPDRKRRALVTGALAYLYRLQDAEVYDPKTADRYEAMWRARMLEDAAEVERFQRGPGTVRFNRQGVW